jgi:hypothetical protein
MVGREVELGDGLAPPQLECLLEGGHRLGRPTVGQDGQALVDEVAEDEGIEAVGGQVDGVAGSDLDHHRLGWRLRRQHLSQAGDLDLQRPPGVFGRASVPERVFELGRRHDLSALEEQHGQERALLQAPKVDKVPVLAYLERPQDGELHTRVRSPIFPMTLSLPVTFGSPRCPWQQYGSFLATAMLDGLCSGCPHRSYLRPAYTASHCAAGRCRAHDIGRFGRRGPRQEPSIPRGTLGRE